MILKDEAKNGLEKEELFEIIVWIPSVRELVICIKMYGN
jgi:hypothetical protein